MAAGETHDQLELIAPSGQVRFYDLDPARGVANIGRHPDNDIVLDSPDITAFHAVLDYHTKPYQIIYLDNAAHAPRELNHYDVVQLDGYSLIVVNSGAAAPTEPTPSALTSIPTAPAALAASAALAAPAPQALALAVVPESAAPPAPSAAEGREAMASTAPQAEPEMDLDMLDAIMMATEAQKDDVIIVEVHALSGAAEKKGEADLDLSIAAGETASLEATITNGGDVVASFDVSLPGIPMEWVSISPGRVNLKEGGRVSVLISITPPRKASVRARGYFYSVIVRSPEYPGRMSSTPGMLVVKPFYQFSVGGLDPRQQTIAYSKRAGLAVLPVINQGNSEACFRVEGEDDRRLCRFEFEVPGEAVALANRAEVRVAPEQTLPVRMRIIPTKRPLVGLGRVNHPFTVTVTALDSRQTPRSVLGQAQAAPLIGVLPIALLALLLVLLIILIYRPAIYSFEASSPAISAGETVSLAWKASQFSSLRLDPKGLNLPNVQGTVVLSPTQDTLYILTADNLLSQLAPQWFRATRQARVTVSAVLPAFRQFSADRTVVTIGDSVNVAWDVLRADSLTLIINGAAETLLPKEHIGNRTLKLDKKTTVGLVAVNAYTPPEGVSRSLVLDVVPVPPVIPPPPIIKRFDVTPQEVTAGQLVLLTWEVTGVTKVNITGIGDLPPSGSVSVAPPSDTIYTLTGSNGMPGGVVSLEQQVLVHPAPSPTPPPGTPKIAFFKALPETAILGSATANAVQLSWQVTGDVTNIEISAGGGTGKSSGLPKNGSMNVAVSKQVLYILTAYNGALTASQTVQINVTNPAPTLSSLQPATTVATGGAGGLTLVVNGSNFIQGSKVLVNNTTRATTYVNAGSLSATLLTDDVQNAGTLNIQVFNPLPGGGTSGLLPLSVIDPQPSISQINPPTLYKGSAGTTIYISGQGFVSGDSKVYSGSIQLPTTFINSSQLNAAVSSKFLEAAGVYAITVRNPAPGGTSFISNSQPFTVSAQYPLPQITAVNPSTVNAGGQGFWLSIQGTGNAIIAGTSLIGWGGIYLSLANTVYTDTNNLAGYIADSQVPTRTGPINVFVLNPSPGGGQSNIIPITLTSPSLSLIPNAVVGTIRTDTQKPITVRISAAQNVTRTISLISSNPSVVSVPPSVDIRAGQTSAVFTATVVGTIANVGANTATLTAQLPAELNSGTAQATVQVVNPAPQLAASPLSPASALLGDPGFNLTVSGQNFVSKAIINWNSNSSSIPLQTTWIDNNTLTAYIQRSYIASSGAVSVTVQNPAPGGSTTAGAPFDIRAKLTVRRDLNGIITSADPAVINCGGSNLTCQVITSTALNTSLLLTASAIGNNAFAGWSGDGVCTGMNPTCTVPMNQNHSVGASFSPAYMLTVNVTGLGNINSDPPGLTCLNCANTTVSWRFVSNTYVYLYASGTASSQFDFWSGAAVGGANCPATSTTCRVLMNGDQTITANFKQQLVLQVSNPTPNIGRVTSVPSGIDCGSSCQAPFTPGVVTVTAVPTAPAQFTRWDGPTCASYGSSPCQITFSTTSITDVVAVFTDFFSLTVATSGGGSGTVTSSNLAEINCPSTCSHNYADGTTVVLTATASGQSAFSGWSGTGITCPGTGTCTVSMTAAQSVTANFFPPRTLTVSKTGSGTVTGPSGINCGSTCSATFVNGTSATLTAVASSGYAFSGWSVTGSAACPGTGTCTVTLNSNVSVTANFVNLYTLTVSKSGSGTGTVVSSPGNINCGSGSACSDSFASGTSVVLTATADALNTFTGWSGTGITCPGTGSCTVNMTAAQSVTANFAPPYQLTVSKSGNGTVVSSPGSINCGSGSACRDNFALNTSVVLTATADPLYTFTGWSGTGISCPGTGTCTILMDGTHNVTANFGSPYLLTVNKTGNGTVVSSPGSINCGATCTDNFTSGTSVVLTATADPLYTFSSWSGSGISCPGTGSCTVSMTVARTVTANFTAPNLLTVNKTGNGTVVSSPGSINCGATCTENFATGTSVVLTATADPLYTFSSWSGTGISCPGTGSCTVSMTTAKTVTANFGSPNGLTVTKAGGGTGTVVGSPGSINCGATCTDNFTSGTSVVLTATADALNTFTGWSGTGITCPGTGTCTVTMTSAKTVTASFTPPYALTVNKSGNGTVIVSSPASSLNCGAICSDNFAGGTSVVLTATADALYTFTGWSGTGISCPGTGTCTVSMTAAKTVTATFAPQYALTVNKSGNGTVVSNLGSINCGATCTDNFTSGTSVVLTASADPLYTFTGWSGTGISCPGTGTCTIVMNGTLNVTANFTPPNTLTVSKAGSGTGTVTSSPGGISCGATCSGAFAVNTSVGLTPTPDSSSIFNGWTGACNGLGSCTVTMSGNQTVLATFVPGYTMTVSRSNPLSGTITSNIGGINCGTLCSSSLITSGTTIQLTVIPSGTTFSTWTGTSGCNNSSANPLSVAMSANETCQANFP